LCSAVRAGKCSNPRWYGNWSCHRANNKQNGMDSMTTCRNAARAAVIALIALVTLLAGCATVPMASADLDQKAKSFVPAPGKASLYVYRNENLGGAVPMLVTVDGRNIGQTAAKTFFWLTVNPGRHVVESHAENTSTLSVDAVAGANYFIWQEVKMGLWMARSALQQVDDQAGRAGVLESKMIAANAAADELGGSGSTTQKLKELEDLRKSGTISEDEFQKKRREILERM